MHARLFTLTLWVAGSALAAPPRDATSTASVTAFVGDETSPVGDRQAASDAQPGPPSVSTPPPADGPEAAADGQTVRHGANAEAAPRPDPDPPAEAAAEGAARPSPADDATAPGVASQTTTVVTATRLPRPLRDVPSTIIVLPRAELDRSPGLTLDAVARTVPSVATFRRSTSLVADPTSQGLNLRAVGPSGVSRALVLLDGAPLSDAFGGWVYWRSVPRLELNRVEVAPGPSSALYGSSALGGVLQLVTRRPDTTGVEGELLGGSHQTVQAALRGSYAWGGGGVSLDAEHLTTAGFMIIPERIAGFVDVPAGGTSSALAAHLDFDLAERVRLRSRAAFFNQQQNGGTEFTTAAVRTYHLSTTLEASLGEGHAAAASLLLRSGTFRQQRARVNEDRSEETLASQQLVPTREVGGALSWVSPTLPLLGEHRLSAGVDARYVRGASLEDLQPFAPAPSALVRREAGGEQLFGGVHLHHEVSFTERLQTVSSVRFDAWRNFGARRLFRRQDGSESTEAFANRSATAFSPRVAVLYRPVERFALRASAGSAFRAPTLNELYRPFQVGTIRTAANPDLGPERLWGGELGVEVTPASALSVRLTGFWNQLTDPVTNATLPEPLPDGSQRQRQNLGAATIQGLEAWLDYRPWRPLTLTAAYTFSDARVSSAPGREELVGLLLPQAPVHRGIASATFDRRDWLTGTVQLRLLGPQFEDDRNRVPLGGYAVLDLSASREVGMGMEFFAAVENLFDRRYLVGRAGIDTLGAPRTFRAGVRLRQR